MLLSFNKTINFLIAKAVARYSLNSGGNSMVGVIGDTPAFDLWIYTPEILILSVSLVMLVILALSSPNSARLYQQFSYWLFLMSLVVALGLILITRSASPVIEVSNLVVTGQALIILLTIVLLLLYPSRGVSQLYIAGIVFFGLILIAADNIILFFISFEALSIISYGLIANSKSIGSAEGSLKYFLYGVVSSAMMVVGLAIFALEARSVNFSEAALYWAEFASFGPTENFLPLISSVMILFAFAYKLSFFPFYMSTLDAYSGAQWFSIIGVGVLIKAIMALTLLRLYNYLTLISTFATQIITIFFIFSAVSLIIGYVGALFATSIKRFYAYTSISQSGFLLLGLAANHIAGTKAFFIYLFAYISASLIFLITMTRSESIRVTNLFDDFYQTRFSLTDRFLLSISLFSMAGLPPFIGFIAKFYIWLSIWDLDPSFFVAAPTVAFLTSIVVSLLGIFMYARLIKVLMFGSRVNSSQPTILSVDTLLSYGFLSFILCLWPIFVYWLLIVSEAVVL